MHQGKKRNIEGKLGEQGPQNVINRISRFPKRIPNSSLAFSFAFFFKVYFMFNNKEALEQDACCFNCYQVDKCLVFFPVYKNDFVSM